MEVIKPQESEFDRNLRLRQETILHATKYLRLMSNIPPTVEEQALMGIDDSLLAAAMTETGGMMGAGLTAVRAKELLTDIEAIRQLAKAPNTNLVELATVALDAVNQINS